MASYIQICTCIYINMHYCAYEYECIWIVQFYIKQNKNWSIAKCIVIGYFCVIYIHNQQEIIYIFTLLVMIL